MLQHFHLPFIGRLRALPCLINCSLDILLESIGVSLQYNSNTWFVESGDRCRQGDHRGGDHGEARRKAILSRSDHIPNCRFGLLGRTKHLHRGWERPRGRPTRKYIAQGLSSQVPDFLVLFNDHASNDFNTLFASLPPDRPYYAAGVPGSFHGRLFPEASLHVVHSAHPLPWLGKLPEELLDANSPAYNKGRVYYIGAPVK